MKYHLTPIQWLLLRKMKINVDKMWKIWTPISCWEEHAVTMENSMVGPQKLKTKLSCCAVLSRPVVSNYLQSQGLQPTNLRGGSPGKNTPVGCHVLLQGVFPTQQSNPGLPQCRQILYHLSNQGSSRILEWVAYLFSSRYSRPRNLTRVSHIADGFFTN